MGMFCLSVCRLRSRRLRHFRCRRLIEASWRSCGLAILLVLVVLWAIVIIPTFISTIIPFFPILMIISASPLSLLISSSFLYLVFIVVSFRISGVISSEIAVIVVAASASIPSSVPSISTVSSFVLALPSLVVLFLFEISSYYTRIPVASSRCSLILSLSIAPIAPTRGSSFFLFLIFVLPLSISPPGGFQLVLFLTIVSLWWFSFFSWSVSTLSNFAIPPASASSLFLLFVLLIEKGSVGVIGSKFAFSNR